MQRTARACSRPLVTEIAQAILNILHREHFRGFVAIRCTTGLGARGEHETLPRPSLRTRKAFAWQPSGFRHRRGALRARHGQRAHFAAFICVTARQRGHHYRHASRPSTSSAGPPPLYGMWHELHAGEDVEQLPGEMLGRRGAEDEKSICPGLLLATSDSSFMRARRTTDARENVRRHRRLRHRREIADRIEGRPGIRLGLVTRWRSEQHGVSVRRGVLDDFGAALPCCAGRLSDTTCCPRRSLSFSGDRAPHSIRRAAWRLENDQSDRALRI